MAEILQFLLTCVQVVAAAFFAMIPGTLFWLMVLGIYQLVRIASKGSGQKHAPAEGSAA
jgi:hypothetical protein